MMGIQAARLELELLGTSEIVALELVRHSIIYPYAIDAFFINLVINRLRSSYVFLFDN